MVTIHQTFFYFDGVLEDVTSFVGAFQMLLALAVFLIPEELA